MKRALPALLLLAACGTSTTRVASGQFSAPSGLAATSAGDRDVLFIANEGRDNLRALQMCSDPLLPDGGVGATTCPASEDFQFLPAPIRVFPGTIETADRPRRLAGVRLSRADQSRTGAVLAAGADSALRLVDARNLVEAVAGKAAGAPALSLPLPAPAVDVVAENPVDGAGLEVSAPAGQAATAFAATVAQGTTPSQLLLLSVAVDPASGLATAPTILGKCSLGAVVPRKLAVVPGGGDTVYVADGAGDGVVAVRKAAIPAPADPPAACPLDRIGAGGRPARSLAASPAFFDDTGAPHAAGELLIMVLEPLPGTQGAAELDPGGVLIARTADKAIAPVPPSSLFDPTATLQRMEPIATHALPREVAFLRPIPPDPANCPLTIPAGSTAVPGACSPLYVGAPSSSPVAKFNLLAAVTSTDGSTYFVDVLKRRFVNSSFFVAAQTPGFKDAIPPVLSPSSSDPNPPQLAVTGFTAGVTQNAQWRLVYQGPFPGLETRGGTLTDSGRGTLLLELPAVDFAAWTSDPALKLAPGDAVSFASLAARDGAPQACSDSIASQSQGLARFELKIVSILPGAGGRPPDTLELSPAEFNPAAPAGLGRSLDVSACPGGVGAVAAVRSAGDRPWIVYENATARGRMKNGESFTAPGRRFDYPLDYTADNAPLAATDVSLVLSLSGNDPTIASAGFSFNLISGVQPVLFSDSTQAQGFATEVISYSSPRHPLLVFSSLTGANAVVQADPSQLTSQLFGVVSYK